MTRTPADPLVVDTATRMPGERRRPEVVTRLWARRDEFDPETVWAIELGRHVAKHAGDDPWAMVTAV